MVLPHRTYTFSIIVTLFQSPHIPHFDYPQISKTQISTRKLFTLTADMSYATILTIIGTNTLGYQKISLVNRRWLFIKENEKARTQYESRSIDIFPYPANKYLDQAKEKGLSDMKKGAGKCPRCGYKICICHH